MESPIDFLYSSSDRIMAAVSSNIVSVDDVLVIVKQRIS